jgi:outer membrane protein assembly factor BamB
MQSDSASTPSMDQGPKPALDKRSRYSGTSFVFSVLAAAFLVLIPIARNAIEDIDRQYANFGGIGCGLLALLFTQLAIATHRRIPWFFKIAAFALPVVAALGFLANYEFAGFNGEVWPTFRTRGSTAGTRPRAPQFIPDPNSRETDPAIDAYRCTQFLGNDRNGVVDSPEFSMKWDVNLPEVVWRRKIGEGWSGFAVAHGRAITLFQQGDKEVVSAWDLKSGQTIWEHEIAGRHYHPMGGLGPRSTPTIVSHNGRDLVLTQSALGIVVCIDCRTGQPVWEVNLLQLAGINQEEAEQDVMWGRSGSPLVIGDLAILPFGGSRKKSTQVNTLIALDLTTGKERWVGGGSQISYASPAWLTIDGETQIVSVNEGNATGHDAKTGNVLWESPWPSKSNADACASQPVQVDGNRILLGKGYAQGSKLIEVRRKKDGEAGASKEWEVFDVWTNTRTLKTKFTNAVIFDGKAYALSDGILECVDPLTGTRLWRGPRYGQGQMLIVNGTILVSAEDGRIASVDPNTGKPIAEMGVLEGITWNTPAVTGPYLLVRNGNEAVCLTSPQR